MNVSLHPSVHGRKPASILVSKRKLTVLMFRLYVIRRNHKMAKVDYQLRYVCMSARMKQLDSHQMDFYEILYLTIFRKSVEKIQACSKYNKIEECFT